MAKQMRHLTVAVGAIFDPQQGFLLFHNKQWNKYAFCMKKSKPQQDLGETALVALEEQGALRFPEATARPL